MIGIIKNKLRNILRGEIEGYKSNKVAYILLHLFLFSIVFVPLYFNNYSSYGKELQRQAQEAYEQIGIPEGFVITNKGGSAHRLAGGYYVEAYEKQKPKTKEEQQALKERVEKYYAKKLAEHGWVKEPGYKYLYKRGDNQWMNVANYYALADIEIRASMTVFDWYGGLKNTVAKEEQYPY